ncbi:MAG TPA: YciI family protein [Gaiellaceae bacterium]|nr:YciI family protein [Gaiellaceae bacterium]
MRRTKKRIVVTYAAGPTWVSGPPEEQPDWDGHADFVDALIEQGTFVMGGPFSDNSGTLVLLEGVTADEAVELVAGDPFVVNGVFVVESVRDWTVYVDELTPAGEPT